jgi:outer membrane protein OmpA-like peptidoglycan-associated protein
LRRDEQFDLTDQWVNPTEAISDLFATNVRSKYVIIPENMFGYEEPFDGENYASVITYAFREKRTRNYIMAELNGKLKKNGIYCISFQASLAERSLYAANNMGVVLSKSKLSSKSANIIDNNALLSKRNPVVNQSDGWWEFCAKYAARGDEQYITIGNFSSDGSTQTETLELPEKYTEAGPIKMAYYYIDMVKITEIQASEQCDCSISKIPESKVIYSATVQLNDDMTITEKVEAIDAYFYQYQSVVVSAAERSIDQIIEIMNANPMMKVQITGHMDSEEVELSKKEPSLKDLDEERAMSTLTYMVSKGIDRGRLTTKGKKNMEPISKMTTPISLAKNRRVEFKIVF